MARVRTEHGRRVGISAKFSEGEAAAIDAARGSAARGVWLRGVALAAAGRGGDGPGPDGAAVPVRASAEPGVRRGQRVVARPVPKEPVAAVSGSCPPHPRARVTKGFCSACKRGVLDGEKVA